MKIILIAPPYPLEEAPSPPLGIASIAAVCEETGAEVIILDYIVTMYSPDKLKRELEKFNPGIIGINSVTMNFKKAAEIISESKKLAPRALTIMGGPHVSFDAENTLNSFPLIDLIINGEGETTISEIIDNLKNNLSWKNIPGISYRNKDSIKINEPRPFIEDLDTLPIPARNLLPLSKYRALGFPISITTSRGCPNLCIFCLGRKMVGYKIRYRSINSVLDEIESLIELGFNIINIADDIFTVKKSRVIEFCNGIKKRDIHFSWSVFSRVNTIDEEMIEIMKNAECTALSFGIESGNRDIIKTAKKGITVEQIYRADLICKEQDIRAHGSFIAGLPGETRESFNDTIDMQKNLNMEYGCHILAPFPGTTIREEIAKYDLNILTDDWNLYDANRAVISTSSLNPEEIMKLVDESHGEIVEKWNDINKRYKNKTTSDEESLMIVASQRTKLIYSILSEDLIENYGTIKAKQEQALDKLINLLSTYTGIDNNLTKIFISRLIDDKLIGYKESKDKTVFYWNDIKDSVEKENN